METCKFRRKVQVLWLELKLFRSPQKTVGVSKQLYIVTQKIRHRTLVHVFAKYLPIVTIQNSFADALSRKLTTE